MRLYIQPQLQLREHAYVKSKSLAFQNAPSHYEDMPIQMYWKFYHQKMKIFR